MLIIITVPISTPLSALHTHCNHLSLLHVLNELVLLNVALLLPLPKLTLVILHANTQLFSLNEEVIPAAPGGPLFSIRGLAVIFWSVANLDGSVLTSPTLEPAFRKSKAFSQFLRF